MQAQNIIDTLGLTPHPEGGWYTQTWQDETKPRAQGTCIYFLLEPGQKSHWHKVDAAEIWHFYAGDPLVLSISEEDTGPRVDHILGPDLSQGQRPQIFVPTGFWQAAYAPKGWTLVGCTVTPGFEFSGFELAPPGFDIP